MRLFFIYAALAYCLVPFIASGAVRFELTSEDQEELNWPTSYTWSWKINSLENNLFYAFGLLSPSLVLLAILSFVIKPSLRGFFSSRVNQRPLQETEFFEKTNEL